MSVLITYSSLRTSVRTVTSKELHGVSNNRQVDYLLNSIFRLIEGKHQIPALLVPCEENPIVHYNDVIMSAIASQITNLTSVYSIVYTDADQGNQSSASLAFVRGIHRGPGTSPHKWPVTRKMYPFDDVIMDWGPDGFPRKSWNVEILSVLWRHNKFTRSYLDCFIGTGVYARVPQCQSNSLKGFRKIISHRTAV